MSKQDLRFEALETLIADGHREIIRRLAWLEEHGVGGEAPTPSMDDWTAGLDRHLLLQRSAFVKTIRSELPITLVATARSLRLHLRILALCIVLNLLLFGAQLFSTTEARALIQRLL